MTMEHGVFSLIIPVYNEEASIGVLLQKIDRSVKQNTYNCEIIIVNDGSTDATARKLEEWQGVRIISHPSNKGYGAALKTGIIAARHDIIVTLDSDGQHNPDDIPKLLIRIDGCDAVIGARDRGRHGRAWALFGKWLLRVSINFLLNKNIPDLNFGYRAYHRHIILDLLPQCCDGFSFSTTILLQLLYKGYRVQFIPVAVHNRIGKSKVTVKAGCSSFLSIFRLVLSFSSSRVVASYCFLIGCMALFCLVVINHWARK